MIKEVLAINCKYHFTSIYYHYDTDVGDYDRRQSQHTNYGTQLSVHVREGMDAYKHRKRKK